MHTAIQKLAIILALTIVPSVSLAGDVTGDALGDAALLDLLKASIDDVAQADLIAMLQNRKSQKVRLVLEGIASDSAASGMVRMQAICSLTGSATGDSVPMLLAIVESDVQERRGFWACAIPLLGGLRDRRAVPLLVRIAEFNEDHLIGMDHMAIQALAQMADERELSLLLRKAHILAVRPAVMQALAHIAAPTSAEVLISGLRDGEEPEVVEAALSGLRRIGRPAIVAIKAALEDHRDRILRSRIRTLLAEMEQ
jgi:HEAT repeat protein